MKRRAREKSEEDSASSRTRVTRLSLALMLATTIFHHGCFEEQKGPAFYGRISVPQSKELRWSNGGLPRIFDPAVAASPPDTDAVRAIFEGLTDYDPQTLEPVPAAAHKWKSEEGGRVWTFYLRADARWTNGDAVTAQDFVRSWKRTLQIGERAPHARLLLNIEGAREHSREGEGGSKAAETQKGSENFEQSTDISPAQSKPFGAIALDAQTLVVRLLQPDQNFPALVSHPVFRPVHELGAHTDILAPLPEGREGVAGVSEESLISNGAFRIKMRADTGVVLEKAETYWDAGRVNLERVRFVANSNSEEALAAYRAGDVDAVTNAAFEPLALKLLAPYKDFRRGIYAALTFYQFNTARAPFSDIRVRESLALALDLERLSADAMGGATIPARKFLPVPEENVVGVERVTEKTSDENLISYDPARARQLLAEAGFAGGKDFPVIRLLVNRNEQQRILANAVAAMWRSGLGIETEVILKNWDEYEAALATGDFDVARRSHVMQTLDEETNMRAMFGDETNESSASESRAPAEPGVAQETVQREPIDEASAIETRVSSALSEHDALRELPAIPIYFAASFSLVKPYIEGFHLNLLDAPSLKHVRVDTSWTVPPTEASKARAWIIN